LGGLHGMSGLPCLSKTKTNISLLLPFGVVRCQLPMTSNCFRLPLDQMLEGFRQRHSQVPIYSSASATALSLRDLVNIGLGSTKPLPSGRGY
jgi:hypothetical protein